MRRLREKAHPCQESYNYQRGKPSDEYVCGNYRKGTRNCTMHYIRTVVVEEIILTVIQRAPIML
ncbi:MAG: zinc ribbon domain-containing protein [Eubacteriaceae bacterium]|nr:zinc ribbon domain-containing protein [Eubacteriaceae bacterium]